MNTKPEVRGQKFVFIRVHQWLQISAE